MATVGLGYGELQAEIARRMDALDELQEEAEHLGAYGDLIGRGLVRAIGASNYTAPRLTLALETSARYNLPRYESLQPLYNLYDRRIFEEELQPLCVRNGLGVVNFYALAAGFLTGKYRTAADAGKSVRGINTVAKYLNARGNRILAALDAVALRHQTQPGSIAIAWQLTRPGITAPIASATSLAQLEGLVAATRLTLDAADLAELDAASVED